MLPVGPTFNKYFLRIDNCLLSWRNYNYSQNPHISHIVTVGRAQLSEGSKIGLTETRSDQIWAQEEITLSEGISQPSIQFVKTPSSLPPSPRDLIRHFLLSSAGIGIVLMTWAGLANCYSFISLSTVLQNSALGFSSSSSSPSWLLVLTNSEI